MAFIFISTIQEAIPSQSNAYFNICLAECPSGHVHLIGRAVCLPRVLGDKLINALESSPAEHIE